MNLIRSMGRCSPRRLRTGPGANLPVPSVGLSSRLRTRVSGLVLLLLLFSGLGTGDSGLQAQTTPPTNLGPIRVTTTDNVGQAGPPANAPSNTCRAYYNTQTGAESWINASGSNCGPSVTGSCPNCIITSGGNASIAGTFGANELQTTGPTPWEIVGECGSFSAPPGGFGEVGLGPNCVPLIYPLSLATQVPIAYQDGSGNVAQNANTATALAATPTPCSGQYATGISANGNAICNTSTIVLIPQQTCSSVSGVSGYGAVCYDASGNLEANLNNAGWGSSFLGYTNLLQTGADTLEQRDGVNAQTFNFYSYYAPGGASYQRLQFSFDSGANQAFNIFSEYNGSPGSPCSGAACNIEFTLGGPGSTAAWMFDTLSRLVPLKTDNTQDIGHSGNRIRDLWVGRAVRTGSSGNTDNAGTIAIAASTTGTYTFANTGYSSSPICTVTPITNPTAVGVYWVTTTTTVLTVNVASSGTITFNFTCFPRN
jgi:hypothetical protein